MAKRELGWPVSTRTPAFVPPARISVPGGLGVHFQCFCAHRRDIKESHLCSDEKSTKEDGTLSQPKDTWWGHAKGLDQCCVLEGRQSHGTCP